MEKDKETHSDQPHLLYQSMVPIGLNVLVFRSHFYQLMRDLEKPGQQTRDQFEAQLELCLYYIREILAGMERLQAQLKEM